MRPAHVIASDVARALKGRTMGPSRRRILALAGAAVFAPSAARWGWAQAYPSRPVRVIVPVAAGGANDTTARLFAQKLSESLGQELKLANHPGAARNTGRDA